MAFERVRQWLRKQLPVKQPDIVEVPIMGVLDKFSGVGQLGLFDVPLLDQPQQQSVRIYPEVRQLVKFPSSLKLQNILVIDDNLSIDQPQIITIPFLALFIYPDILDLFTQLRYPGSKGKDYTPEEKTVREPSLEDTGPLDQTRCRHGMVRFSCEICARERQSRSLPRLSNQRIRKQITIDVFDLLLPYLQPPIEVLLSSTELLPPGRRPYDFQIEGIRFLVENTSALLGDEMGLGKTIQTIIALQVLFQRGTIRKVLILCRRSLLGNWEHELKKWASEFIVLKIRGNQTDRSYLWDSPGMIFLTTYDTLRSDIRNQPDIIPAFDVAVLDEIQDIKNPNSQRSQAVRRIKADYRWGLSGTPIENKTEDVVSIFHFLKPGLFRRDYVPPAYSVKDMIKPYFLRRRIRDVLLDLPDKVSSEIWLDLTDAQEKAYTDAYQIARESLSRPSATRIHALQLVNRLRQICNQDERTGQSCKLDYLCDQLDNIIDNDQKALVFSVFPNVTLRKIKPELNAFDPAIFDGSLSDRQREALIQNFQENDSPKVMLTSTRAGGVGLNLTRANHVFHFDHWWNPAVERQAEARAHRIGQQLPVFVYDIYTRETIEERVHELLLQKQHLFDSIIDDLSADYVKGALTDEDLFALFDLKPPEAKSEDKHHITKSSQEDSIPVITPIKQLQDNVEKIPHSSKRSKIQYVNLQIDKSNLSDVPRDKLKEFMTRYGPSLCSDRRYLHSLLTRYCGEYKAEISILLSAVSANIPNELLNRSKLQQQEPSTDLSSRLVDAYRMSPQNAQWAVESWIFALGINKTSSQIPPSKTHESRTAPRIELPSKDAGRSTGVIGKFVLTQPEQTEICIPNGSFLFGVGKIGIILPQYWIDKSPVTNVQYKQFIDVQNYKAPKHWSDRTYESGKEHHPVVGVSFHDAMAYCAWLGKRLPTEQEWEKAARGTDGRTYPWGNTEPTSELCNFNGEAGGTSTVGSYSPQGDSPYGCTDMAGNVNEWTLSYYDRSTRTVCGGRWNDVKYCLRCTYRTKHNPTHANLALGFRCVSSTKM